MRTIPFLLILLLSATIVLSEEVRKDTKVSALIKQIKPAEPSPGDTIRIQGLNFGQEQTNRKLNFGSVQADNIMSWSDTLITSIVPLNAESNIFISCHVSNDYEAEINDTLFIAILKFLIKISLFITVLFIYLQVNKIWKRKHEQEVADSQSLSGLFIYVLNCILWVLFYVFVEYNVESIIDTSVYIFQGGILFLIGTGVFVKGLSRKTFTDLIKRSLRIERNEADYLWKRMFRPVDAKKILVLLHQLAMIDDHLDKKEIKILKKFADEWGLEYNPDQINQNRKNGSHNFIQLRNDLRDYLEDFPPKEQISHLREMIEKLIMADKKVSEEEELIQAELLGLIDSYLNGGNGGDLFNVVIIPQQTGDDQSIKVQYPEAVKIDFCGGYAYSVGEYHSKEYAAMVCDEYKKNRFLSVVKLPFNGNEGVI